MHVRWYYNGWQIAIDFVLDIPSAGGVGWGGGG